MGSFKGAADMLYTTQPHISKTIKSLEDELQVTLLERKARGVQMTPEGRRVYEYAVSMLRNADQIRQIQTEKQYQSFSVSSNQNWAAAGWFSEFVRRYQESDGYRFRFLVENVEVVLQHVQKEISELGLIYISDHQLVALESQLGNKSLEFVSLKKTDVCLYVGPESPYYKSDSEDESILKYIRTVQYPEKYFSVHHHLGHLKEEAHHSHQALRAAVTNSDHAMSELIRHGGLSYLGGDLKEPEDLKDIHRVKLKNMENELIFGYIKKKRRDLSGMAREFTAYLKEEIKENDRNGKDS